MQVTLDKPKLAVPAWEWILTVLIGILGLVQQVKTPECSVEHGMSTREDVSVVKHVLQMGG